jgi:hypothetical protein
VYIGGGEEVLLEKKDIQKLIYCFHIHQLLSFEILVVGSITERST